jgi:hypothetical protein
MNYTYEQEDWGAIRPMADGTYGTFEIDKIVIHWGGSTEVPDPPTVEWEMDRLRRWDRYHYHTRGWKGGLAYGAGVGNTGSSYRSRGFNQQGATSGDYEPDGTPENKEAFALLWIGGSASEPSQAALDEMGRIVREIQDLYPEADLVIGHQDVKGDTSCPGPVLMDWIKNEGWKLFDDPAWYAASSWQKAKDKGYVNRDSDPWAFLSKQDFFVFGDRMGLLE